MGKFKSGHLYLKDAEQIKLGTDEDAVLSWNNTSGVLSVGADDTGIDFYDTVAVAGKIDFVVDSTVCLTINNSHNLVVGDSTGNGTYTLPLDDGSTDDVLSTNGSGTVTWGAPAGGDSFQIVDGDTDTYIRTEASAANDDDYYYGEIAGVSSLLADDALNSNCYFGYNIGEVLDSAAYRNTMFGYTAGTAMTTGDDNVVIGYGTGIAINSGSQHVFIGSTTGTALDAAIGTTLIGYGAGTGTIGLDSSYAIGIGHNVLQEAGTGAVSAVAIGQNTMIRADSPGASVAIGQNAMTDADMSAAIAIGPYAGQYGTGDNTVALGNYAYQGSSGTASSATSAVAIGYYALKNASSASYSIAIGAEAMAGTTTIHASGNNGIAIGYSAMEYGADGAANIAIGANALQGTTTYTVSGDYNVALGYVTGQYLADGDHNVAIGPYAMQATSSSSTAGADYNVAIGRLALRYVGAGATYNVAIGYNALGGSLTAWPLVTGDYNVVLGHQAGENMSTGQNNILIGRDAGRSDYTDSFDGDDNICIGYQAGYSLTGSDTSSGANNVLIGRLAGTNLEGTTSGNSVYNICIGYQTGDNLTTGSSNIIIGESLDASSATVDDELRIGNTTPTISADLSSGAVSFANGAYTFPTANGDSGDVLTDSDGSGTLAWTAAAGGDFTSAEDTDVDIIDSPATIDSFNPTQDGAVVWFYHVTDGTNARVGQIMAAWDDSAGTVTYTEVSTVDIGDTSGVTLVADMSGASGTVRFQASVTTDNWIIRVKRLEI